MSSNLVLVTYLVALAVPLALLYFFRSRAWYWHALSVAAAITLGVVPTPVEWKIPAFDLIFGFAFIALIVWGLGGLLMFHQPRHHRHA
jgi:hypothetical protein